MRKYTAAASQAIGSRVGGGSGGSWVLNDCDVHMTIAFVMNRHVEAGGWDQRSVDIVNAIYDCLAA